MRRAAWLGGLLTAIAACTLVAAAQIGGKPVTGNPTPGTEQPAPPNLADRVTLIGCLGLAPKNGGGQSAEATDANTPSDSRFVLTSADRQDRVPPGTGGSTLAASARSRTYRLEGIDSQFSPFAGTKVEISGEIKPPSPGTPGRGASGNAPTLLVEFVQKIASTCS
jgi:hypothetical protein